MSNVRLAATVILARPLTANAGGFEVYMTRRSTGSRFAPNAFVFPGGTLGEQDTSAAVQARTLGLERDRLERTFRARVPAELPAPEGAVDFAAASGLLVAALRELFEEAGVLIASGPDGTPVDADRVRSARMHADRIRVREGELAFADFLLAHDLYADARTLALFSHWITPPTEPHRYSTHFFFALAPPEQAAHADAFETHDGTWIGPAQALAQRDNNGFSLVYPTIKHLERLAALRSADEALAFARHKPVLTIMPRGSHVENFRIPPGLEGTW